MHLINICIPLSLKSNPQSVSVYKSFTLLFHIINSFLPLFSSSTTFSVRSRQIKPGPFSFCCSIEGKRTLYTNASVGILSITLDKKCFFFFIDMRQCINPLFLLQSLTSITLQQFFLHHLGLYFESWLIPSSFILAIQNLCLRNMQNSRQALQTQEKKVSLIYLIQDASVIVTKKNTFYFYGSCKYIFLCSYCSKFPYVIDNDKRRKEFYCNISLVYFIV